MTLRRLIASSVLLIPTVAIIATAQTREAPPAGGKPKPFNVPASQTFTLKNGMRVTMIPYGLLPKASIVAVVRAGHLNEAADQIWLSDLAGEYLKEGAGSRSGSQLAEEFGRIGGQLSIAVGDDRTNVSTDVLSEFVPDAVALLGDVLQRPALPPSELPRLLANQVRRLAVEKSSPQATATEIFRKALYPNHRYGQMFPAEEALKSYTHESVMKFYKANFGAQRTHVYVAGRFPAEAKQAITAAFEKWDKGAAPVVNVPTKTAAKSVHLMDRPEAAQSTVRVGLPTPDPTAKDYIPLQVTNSLLGGSFASRITRNIREQKGYTYSPFSMISTRYHDAYWVEAADVTTSVTGPAIGEIYNEIRDLRQKPPGEPELQGITSLLAGLFVIQNSSPRGIISQLDFVEFQGLDDNWLRTYVQRVEAVKPQDVQRIAETYLDPNKMTLVIVGDKAKIEGQVEPFRKAHE